MKILGLDLGSASIGWAMIMENEDHTSILGLGSRIIPYDGTEGKDFEKGVGESRNSLRTKARTARKGYDRYQLRRKALENVLLKHEMYPGEIEKLMGKDELWALRSRAPRQQITLPELGRLLFWLNQKRGYKSSRSDANLDKKDTEYVAKVKSRHDMIREANVTIGQYFYQELSKDEQWRVKENIFPRQAYIEEFDAILSQQQQHYAELTDELVGKIRNEIIYYQRPLKSQKGLVAVCEFECKEHMNANGKKCITGPKVAAKSSPLFQIVKIWENINNIRISDISGAQVVLTFEQKQLFFTHLDNNDKLTESDLLKILGRTKKESILNKQIKAGLNGNITKSAIVKCFGDKIEEYRELFRLNLNILTTDKQGYLYDRKTGEVLGVKPQMMVDPRVEKEPFYRLWHTIYSINDQHECEKALVKNFHIEHDIAEKLAALDLGRSGFGNKSVRVLRNILPYLQQGDDYSQAMSYAGYDHSNSLTKDENLARELLDTLKPLGKNSLRQPIVEKILNQMISVVNAVTERYGKADEIRIELARELKQSKDERNETDSMIRTREKEGKKIAENLAEYGLRATRNNIIKWRLYHELKNEDKRLNATCIYCGQPISLTEAIMGNDVDVEHIIPKAKLFDDSQSNKTLAHRHCNSTKDDRTAYDFMTTKSTTEFNDYVQRVNSLYANHMINRAKRNKLLMSKDKIPQDFIDRQLRESQYIARKAREILQSICRNVWSTSGGVTAELRRLWGWDDVTMSLQFDRYKRLGLTSVVEWESEHGRYKHQKEVITGFSKRDDHRHHAVDALVIACTKQGYIQRLNTLSSSKTKEDMERDVQNRSMDFKVKMSLLEKYLVGEQPFTFADVARATDAILVSFKAGKKVATRAKRKIGRRGDKRVVQTGIIVPRGALSEESVYGKIKVLDKNKPLKYIFQNPDLIYKPSIREMVNERLSQYDGDMKKALASLKKEPIYMDDAKQIELQYATCFKYEYVIKYTVNSDFNKVDKVIDADVRKILEARLAKFGGKCKEAFKDVQLEDKTSIKWYQDEGLKRPIRSVRCFTGLSAVVPVKKDEQGHDIGFVKPGNNHHLAIYRDKDGKAQEHIVTFWHAVERKTNGLPVIITSPSTAWDSVEEKDLPVSFLENLPDPSWTFEQSIQQNEMFILGMEDELFSEAWESNNYPLLSKYLYRAQKLTRSDYCFRHHLETTTDDKYGEIKNEKLSINIGKYKRVASLGAWTELKPHKVKINLLGEIISNAK